MLERGVGMEISSSTHSLCLLTIGFLSMPGTSAGTEEQNKIDLNATRMRSYGTLYTVPL
ncbi:hypothetical protein GCM10007108_11390 [Thermogymnomonas acidicola]|uniref:Uncharacterized protein n=1 Tax=Thermogymnomonas acidicola TaxID=399579 RepID=A0AA37F9J7_9ARCH|nr:hypothetical protein GCM10007108_11390 [Thermogymnomonas acidicola]